MPHICYGTCWPVQLMPPFLLTMSFSSRSLVSRRPFCCVTLLFVQLGYHSLVLPLHAQDSASSVTAHMAAMDVSGEREGESSAAQAAGPFIYHMDRSSTMDSVPPEAMAVDRSSPTSDPSSSLAMEMAAGGMGAHGASPAVHMRRHDRTAGSTGGGTAVRPCVLPLRHLDIRLRMHAISPHLRALAASCPHLHSLSLPEVTLDQAGGWRRL